MVRDSVYICRLTLNREVRCHGQGNRLLHRLVMEQAPVDWAGVPL